MSSHFWSESLFGGITNQYERAFMLLDSRLLPYCTTVTLAKTYTYVIVRSTPNSPSPFIQATYVLRAMYWIYFIFLFLKNDMFISRLDQDLIQCVMRSVRHLLAWYKIMSDLWDMLPRDDYCSNILDWTVPNRVQSRLHSTDPIRPIPGLPYRPMSTDTIRHRY